MQFFHSHLFSRPQSLTVLCLLLLAFSNVSQAKWDIEYQGNNLTVSSKPAEVGEFVVVKGSVNIEATINEFYQLLTDEALAPTWLDKVVSTELIAQVNENEYVVHTIFESFGLVQAREMLTLSTIIEKTENRLEMTSVDYNHYLPINRQYTRVKMVDVKWQATRINETRIQVNYVGSFDPAGKLPVWLSNNLAVTSLITSLKNLKQITSKADST